jgi:hypothetical protein
MAHKRMIDKKISVSEDVANLTLEAKLLFTWMIPHADDVGLLPYSARSLKALVVPMVDEITSDRVKIHLDSMVKSGLVENFEWFDDKFVRIRNFSQHQTLKKDRKPLTIAKYIEDWNTVETIWKALETQGAKGAEGTKGAEGATVALDKLKKELKGKIKGIK